MTWDNRDARLFASVRNFIARSMDLAMKIEHPDSSSLLKELESLHDRIQEPFMPLLCPSSEPKVDCDEFSIFEEIPQPFVRVQNTSEVAVADAVAQIVAAGGGTLYFPAGAYFGPAGGPNSATNAARITIGNDVQNTSITNPNIQNLLICGDGVEQTIVGINDWGGRPQPRILSIIGAENVEIRDMDFDGMTGIVSPQTLPAGNENGNNVFIRNTRNLHIKNVRSYNADGDGLNIGTAENVLIDGAWLDSNSRNGLTLGASGFEDPYLRRVLVCNTYFGANNDTQQIDMEDSELEDVWILDNTFAEMPEDFATNDQYAIIVNAADRVLIRGNDLDNPLLIRGSRDVEVSNNINIEQTVIDRQSERITFCRNKFNFQQPSTDGNPNSFGIGFRVREIAGLFPNDIIVDSNEFSGQVGGVPNVEYLAQFQDVANFRWTNNVNSVTPTLAPLLEFQVHAQNISSNYQFSGNANHPSPNEIQTGQNVAVQSDEAAIPCISDTRTKEELMPITRFCVPSDRLKS